MKKLLILILLLNGFFLYGQENIANLESLNGFKDFKFGKSKAELASLNFIVAGDTNDKDKIDEAYCFNCKDEYIKFGYQFSSLFVNFYQNQLYEIQLFKDMSLDELNNQIELFKKYGFPPVYQLINDELNKLFGKPNESVSLETNSKILIGYKSTWKSQTITLIFEWSVLNNILSEKPQAYFTIHIRKNQLYNSAILSNY